MELLISKLTEVVEQEVKQYELFLNLLTEQQNHLVENDLDALNNVVRRQEEAILTTRELEKSRMRIVNELSVNQNKDPNDMTLSLIARDLAKPQAERLQTMQKKLLDLHAKISKVKSRNEFLIKKSMEYIEGTFRLFATVDSKNPTYSSGARIEKKPASIVVNRTV